jgi:uncharacterized protein YndB with AHSA1/START domain
MPKLHQEVTFSASPAKVYRALMDSAEHARFTGAPAEISAEAGGAFSAYGGKVQGRNVEVVPNTRIVQAWRPADWPEGVYTIARFELRGEGDKTHLVFDQDGIPSEAVAHLDGGWARMYWEPLRKYLES